MTDPALIEKSLGKVGTQGANSRQLRDLWAIDQRERVVRLAQSAIGKVVLVGLCAAMARLAGVGVLFVLLAAAFAYLPKWRNWIVLAGAVTAVVRNPKAELAGTGAILLQEGLQAALAPTLGAAALIVYFACACGALALVRRNKTLFLARRPVVSLLGVTALLCGLASAPLLHGLPRAALWAFLTVFTAYIWFFAYALMDQRSREPGPLLFQVGILHPFWGSSATPLGKGAAFLRKHQSKSAEELAVTQLKGLKLLAWALLLILVNKVLVELFEVRLGIPRPELAYAAFMKGAPLPIWSNWASLVWATFGGTLTLAIWGHKIIAVARLAGYRLPRNTWRPLESRTLAEFWNRYYYYFKELLVEFFFFPTFLRVFRKHPRLRVFFATFMAAGVGNAIYHFIGDIEAVAIMGLWPAAESYASYLFYCVVLATGIGISQARMSAGRKPSPTFMGSLWSVLCVWSFFVCLHVFGDGTRILSLRDRFSFFASLFGL
ncbi:hypothetical protein D3878_21755 [Noviherbaspirillum sedimenti]|uniref:Uncharacterized protein n=2 Tax=Noviherbaspirillum sedimenti TaxID=2320865 RepID=A0A3A3G5U5_9BURK|nr:hypothetical protein D3878_21755 [Noviherbaspirillum sedimenti]